MSTDFSKPQEVTAIELAFPATVRHLTPEFESIPKRFRFGSTPQNKLQQRWFFSGVQKSDFPPTKEGIDREVALRHLACIQGSFEPKHEHKEAAVAYLMSLWFDFPEAA